MNRLRFKVDIKTAEGQLSRAQLRAANRLIETAQRQLADDRFSIARINLNHADLRDQPVLLQTTKQCLYANLAGAVGPDAEFHPCDHRTYKGGGSFGSIDDWIWDSLRCGSRTRFRGPRVKLRPWSRRDGGAGSLPRNARTAFVAHGTDVVSSVPH